MSVCGRVRQRKKRIAWFFNWIIANCVDRSTCQYRYLLFSQYRRVFSDTIGIGTTVLTGVAICFPRFHNLGYHKITKLDFLRSQGPVTHSSFQPADLQCAATGGGRRSGAKTQAFSLISCKNGKNITVRKKIWPNWLRNFGISFREIYKQAIALIRFWNHTEKVQNNVRIVFSSEVSSFYVSMAH